jgi:hypothetical protein
MQEEQYTNFENSLFEAFPGFSALGFNKRCLVPGCSSSIFKNVDIKGGKCLPPKCMNIFSFNNNGTIDGSKVEINQNIEGCANLVQDPEEPEDPGEPEEPEDPEEPGTDPGTDFGEPEGPGDPGGTPDRRTV